MKFSPDGPDIPSPLMDAAINGDVVFLCGAGVSSPALPGFEGLTKSVFTRLSEEFEPAEVSSFAKGRFEETLGSLARRLADRRLLYDAVAHELDANKATDLSHHSTILRLSRDFEGRPAVVTTNFDTLFERALGSEQPLSAKAFSFAGAQVPAPGSTRFQGVIHLHGRLSDEKCGIEKSDLVLTSADYGDAYLRAGWASRFLFDLARTRVIVLVGYSAEDPPVRYILNILEADRERFPDLKLIYALAADQQGQPELVRAPWDAIAVTPIVYPVHDKDFGPFWLDMASWADLVELPRRWRKRQLESLAARPFDQLAEWELDQATWVLSQADAYELLPNTHLSAEWIALMRSRGLLRADKRMEYSIGRWAAHRLGDTRAFSEILAFADKLGAEAAEALERGLGVQGREPLPAHLEKAWRILTIYLRENAIRTDEMRRILAEDRVSSKSATATDWDIVVEPFQPRLRLRSPYRAESAAGSLSELVRIELEPERDIDASDLLKRVKEGSRYSWPLLMAANSAMFTALAVATEAELTGTDFDAVSLSVPSVGTHAQNAIRTGFLPLTAICAESWLRLRKCDKMKAHAISQTWRASDFRLLKRLWLFSLAHDQDLNADQIVEALLELSEADFWEIRKELMELIRDRAGDATEGCIRGLVDRILVGPPLRDRVEPELRADFSNSAIWGSMHLT